MSYKIDLPNVLERAESLVLHIRQSKDVPKEIVLLTQYSTEESHADNGTVAADTTCNSPERKGENGSNESDSDVSCDIPQSDKLGQTVNLEEIKESSDEVVELSKDTKSVF